ncbi:hypothetical protein Poli38472_007140 [Pythium oligandrum]|uniref:BZIP domain-containing protein n=1 Tax=Pythium oligandrum TaxID=41045 RepID=A0A8K1FD27_PYTOL|nr:hypothetical protein Poli38472_007140 [Pythium oligandrum]|eukprot:TMW58995.1 hypothetical protein Poli38472_007140 [Pythium oligandrum]
MALEIMEPDMTTLDAVLAFIDGFEDGQAVKATSVEHTSASMSKRVASERKRTQEKRRHEHKKLQVEQLRREVAELQAVLGRLKGTLLEKHGRKGFKLRMKTLGGRKELTSMWKRMAQRQLERRQAAEEENEQLKKHVEKQWRALVGLQRIVHFQLTSAMNVSASIPRAPSSSSIYRESDPRSHIERCAELLVDVQDTFDDLQTWLGASQAILASDEKPSNGRVVSVSTHQLAIEFADVRAFPFSVGEVADAYWHAGVNQACALDSVSENAEVDGRATYFQVQRMQDTLNSETTNTFHVRMDAAIQRFIEKDRVVVLQARRSLMVPSQGDGEPNMNLAIRQWSVLNAPDGASRDSCTLTTIVRFVLQLDPGASFTTERTSAWSAYTMHRIPQALNVVSTRVEDHLLRVK